MYLEIEFAHNFRSIIKTDLRQSISMFSFGIKNNENNSWEYCIEIFLLIYVNKGSFPRS